MKEEFEERMIIQKGSQLSVSSTQELMECDCGSNSEIAHYKGCNSLLKYKLGQEPMEWESEFERDFGGFWMGKEVLKHFISSQIKQAKERERKMIVKAYDEAVKIAERKWTEDVLKNGSSVNPMDYIRREFITLINQNNE